MTEMKLCRRCGELLPAGAFHRRGSQGTQAWCKPCRKEYDRAYHARTRALRLQQKKRWRKEFTDSYRRLKSNTPCADCGGLFHHAAMQWDHLPGTEKVAELSTLFRKGNKRAFLLELAKCELVCSNCHAVRSFQRTHGA
jgi:hypothetical protein